MRRGTAIAISLILTLAGGMASPGIPSGGSPAQIFVQESGFAGGVCVLLEGNPDLASRITSTRPKASWPIFSKGMGSSSISITSGFHRISGRSWRIEG